MTFTNNRFVFILPIVLIVFAAVMRLLPHPANIAPVAAIALFGGLYLPRKVALILPLTALAVSDVFLGGYNWKIMIAVYGSFLLIALIGLLIRKKKNVLRIGGGVLSGSMLFFLITNAAVWKFGTLYPHTLDGLLESYIAALPFFRNSLIGDVLYSTFLIGGYECVSYLIRRVKQQVKGGQETMRLP